MTDDERRLRSGSERHEASHAVVGLVQGTRIHMIVVRPMAEGLGGFCSQHPRPDLSPLEAAIVDLTILEAGAIGQKLVYPAVEPVRLTDEEGYAALTERLTDVFPAAADRAHVKYALSDARPEPVDDEAQIATIAAQFAPDEAIWLMAFCRARATRLVAENAGPILALAAELSRRPILDGPTAEAIIEAAQRS